MGREDFGRGYGVVPLPAHNGRLQVPHAELQRRRQSLPIWCVQNKPGKR